MNLYDAIDETTGKRKHTWKCVHHRYKRVRHIWDLGRFRKYLEDHGKKKQKIDDIDTFVFGRFEAARETFLLSTTSSSHARLDREYNKSNSWHSQPPKIGLLLSKTVMVMSLGKLQSSLQNMLSMMLRKLSRQLLDFSKKPEPKCRNIGPQKLGIPIKMNWKWTVFHSDIELSRWKIDSSRCQVEKCHHPFLHFAAND